MINLTHKHLQYFLAFLSFLVLALSFYFEYYQGFLPCPLCIMQRLCVGLLLLLSLLNSYINPLRLGKFLSLSQIFFALAGLFFAGRQLWLQSLPAEKIPVCMPGLDILIRYFSLSDILRSLVWGAGDCAEVSWQWLGLSMPAWAALYFLVVVIASSLCLFKLK